MKKKIAQEAILLIVDDDPGVLEILAETLKPYFAQVLVADGGEQALFILKRHAVNIMLVDQRMGGISGVELMHEVKKFNPLMPFIMLTGYSEDTEVQEALDEGVFDVLEKPFNKKILINRLINALILPKMVRVLWSSLMDYLPSKEIAELEAMPLEKQLDVLYSYSGLLQTKNLKKKES